MYLYGAGGHAKVIIDILKSRNIIVDGLVDDYTAINSLLDYPVYHNRYDLSPMIVSIGDNFERKTIVKKLSCRFETAIHSSSIISDYAHINEGSVIMQNVVIQSCAVIGKHCIINTSASVDHDCIIDDYVHIAPNVALCGNVRIGEGSLIGVGSCISPGVKIGKWCIIGAGSVVVNDIPDFSMAYGNKCKIMKINDMKSKILNLSKKEKNNP